LGLTKNFLFGRICRIFAPEKQNEASITLSGKPIWSSFSAKQFAVGQPNMPVYLKTLNTLLS